MSQSEILADTSAHSEGAVVFFDVLVHYSELVGIIINLVTVVASIWTTVNKILHSYNYGVSKNVYIRQLGFAFAVQVCGCVASFVSVTLIATFMDSFSRPMAWYR